MKLEEQVQRLIAAGFTLVNEEPPGAYVCFKHTSQTYQNHNAARRRLFKHAMGAWNSYVVAKVGCVFIPRHRISEELVQAMKLYNELKP